MSDKEPLLFKPVLGSLKPMTAAAQDAVSACGDNAVRVEIVRARGNVRRMAWYWVMLKIALENLGDAFDGPVTPKHLHRWLKREAGLAKPIRSKKTGEIVDYDYDSISFAKMAEHERAAFVDFASETLAKRLGCHPADLEQQAKAA